MPISFTFTTRDNLELFKKFLKEFKRKYKTYFKTDEYGLLFNIDKTGNFTYPEILAIMTKYQEIENLFI